VELIVEDEADHAVVEVEGGDVVALEGVAVVEGEVSKVIAHSVCFLCSLHPWIGEVKSKRAQT